MKDRAHRLVLAALLLTPLLYGCGEKEGEKPAPSEEIFPVQVMTVQPGNMLQTLSAVGTVRYRRETPLGFTTAGKVAVVRFEEGDYVRQGALLAALDTTSVGADLSAAEAERSRAQAEFDRIKQLYAEGWITKARYEAAEASAKAASARVAQAGFARGTALLYAPSSGVVLTRNVQPGQIVAAGTPALVLGEGDDGFVFRAPVIDRNAARLRVGMAAEISLPALGSAPVTATISEIDGRANQATGAFTVQFSLPASAQLKSGQIGTASIKLPAAEDGSLQIPASAILGVRANEALVYIVDPKSQRVETRNVAIERITDGAVVITGGLKQGDLLVTSGAEKLRTGAKVRMTKAPG
ncbi:efflux RND transporter periplasmic adaptor subunit [Sphingorhabdus sp.]|uniref:efflux RND transporter periplasmic adaptor subunit n=1 Tax=Sphingorhabdus sp. TaxID=1902408 RepID=UPI0035B3255E